MQLPDLKFFSNINEIFLCSGICYKIIYHTHAHTHTNILTSFAVGQSPGFPHSVMALGMVCNCYKVTRGPDPCLLLSMALLPVLSHRTIPVSWSEVRLAWGECRKADCCSRSSFLLLLSSLPSLLPQLLIYRSNYQSNIK